MATSIQTLSDLNEIVALLRECDLPVADISPSRSLLFFGIRTDVRLSAVVGLELFDSVVLLRSLAVSPADRGRGLARGLVAHAERYAEGQGVASLFLLTTSAITFFTQIGFKAASRSSAPAAIRATAQFAGLCPAAAAFLCKSIAVPLQS